MATKKRKRSGYLYDIYVPQNSGLADELGSWGWVRVRLQPERASQYQRAGFAVLPAPESIGCRGR